MMKELEGEVLDALELVGGNRRLEMETNTVDPHQFIGIEKNPRAARIADLVLWLGYLQWHYRTHGNVQPPSPVLKAFKNIIDGDAVLSYTSTRVKLDPNGRTVTRWDGVTKIRSPITGLEIPDENAQIAELEYIGARASIWPDADFIVGNPPFIGAGPMRAKLGDGYATAVRKAHPDVPESADFVAYWWNQAAKLLKTNQIERFGLVTTNSIKQTFSRRVLEAHLNGKQAISLLYAIPDHPWIDSEDGAKVRIAVTVAARGNQEGELKKVSFETTNEDGEFETTLERRTGIINANLTIGANVAGAGTLKSNAKLSNRGLMLFGAGFIITTKEAKNLGLGEVAGLEKHIRLYRNGKDLTGKSRDALLIDFFALSVETVRLNFPAAYQWILERVKPERDQNNDRGIREHWWQHGRPRPQLRDSLQGLHRYIATVETAKHRVFQFLSTEILPDNMLVNIALEDGYSLGVLSSRVHIVWALAAGGTLEDRPRYNKSVCFEKFAFPDPTESQGLEIAAIAETIDTHRKRQLMSHPKLTLTQMYNTLEVLRSGKSLSNKEKQINALGLVSTLLELHEQLDNLVLEVYGWANTLSDAEILDRLVELNLERQHEEAKGTVRYLRPAYQNPSAKMHDNPLELPDDDEDAPAVANQILAFPKTLGEQSQAIRNALRTSRPLSAREITQRFKGAKPKRVAELLELLENLGQIRTHEGQRYTHQNTLETVK